MRLIGLTGGIASGKTTVRKMFERMGAYTLDADELSHKALHQEDVYQKLLKHFGNVILNESGEIDRKKLGQIVINNKQELRFLESVVHPKVAEMREAFIENVRKKDRDAVIVYDVPLLYEKKMENMFDVVIVVYIDRETQIKRIMERNKISEEEAEKRLKLQMDIEEKKKRAQIVIDNRGTKDDTFKQVKNIWSKIKGG
ncbi:MAG: dephospho-CoA kinase [Deltaproteobacteria bacterium]|nr:dephospho-CoA kinase [Deltaproteobacteria bacterium]